jgi:hypothetical protein
MPVFSADREQHRWLWLSRVAFPARNVASGITAMEDELTTERIVAGLRRGARSAWSDDVMDWEKRSGELRRTTQWLLVCLASIVMAPQVYEWRRGGPVTLAEPTQVRVGQKVPGVITSADGSCTGSVYPCRVFQVSVDKSGVLRASLTWPEKTNGLRLELWNGDNAQARCCDSGESVAISLTRGDRAEIDVVFVTSKSARQTFELNTWLQRIQK